MYEDWDEYWEAEDFIDDRFRLWHPTDAFGWTWLPKMNGALETYSLLDADGELLGHVYQRFGRVICWAPFIWAEEVYRSNEDIGKYAFENEEQRCRHFRKIGQALSEWVARKKRAGVDLAILRDMHAYYYECSNGSHQETLGEGAFFRTQPRWTAQEEEANALAVDGWSAVRNTRWWCESYRLRDAAGQLRGQVQVRYGVVRAVAAGKEDADRGDPLLEASLYNTRTCRGQIVLQEKTRPMAVQFGEAEREGWIRKAVGLIRATRKPDRSWPPETLGARGTPGQRMFPLSRRDPK